VTEKQPDTPDIPAVKLTGLVSVFARHNKDIEQCAKAWAEASYPAVLKASIALTNFSRGMYAAAETAYLKHHATLPGSHKTKRLRKKRRTNVLNWYWQQIKLNR